MNEQLFIMPEECLAAEVSTLMLTKKYFDKYLSKVENKQIIENLIEFQINLPIIWINQEHSFNVQEIKKNSYCQFRVPIIFRVTVVKNSRGELKSPPRLGRGYRRNP